MILDIHLEIPLELFPEKCENGRDIKIILVLCRLLGLGLNVKIALKTDVPCIIHGKTHQSCHVVQLNAISVWQRLITLSPAQNT